MAAGETFKATVIGQLTNGTAIVYDYGYADVSGSVHLDMGTAAGDFQSLVQASIVNALPTTYAVYRYRFACVGGAHKGEIGYVEVSPPVAGTISGDQLPAEVAIALKRSTGHASRRDRGRVFFGPVDASFWLSTDPDHVQVSPALSAVRATLQSTLASQTVVLRPVILAADGSYSGNIINQTSIGPIFVQRKSRRLRAGA